MLFKDEIRLGGLYVFLMMKRRFGLEGMINYGKVSRKYKET